MFFKFSREGFVTIDFSDVRAIIFDLEGVFFAGDAVLPGGIDVMKVIEEKNIPHRFITNISKQNVSEIYDHMFSIGLTPEKKNIIGLLDYAGIFLRRIFNDLKTVFVIGSEELRFSVSNAGFEDLTLENPDHVDIVLTGLDEELTYFSLSKASFLVTQGAQFVAMNSDVRRPSGAGTEFMLGGGAIAEVVRVSSGKDPVVIGKPSTYLFDEAIAQMNFPTEKILMVGDNLRTDILGASNLGMKTVWVNRWGKIKGDPEVNPDLEIKTIGELIPFFPF
ncbi:MAG: HAD-IIA family hydrolase [Nitrospinota bacterium]|nr:HAD-IIA family hydrolase [Nitrospinota bacterium]